MKIAIISDSHDNLPNIYKALEIIKKEKIRTIIHCGDVCAPSTFGELIKNFTGKIHLVFGNVDGKQFRITEMANKNVKIHGEMGEVKIGGKKIAFTHFPWAAKALSAENKYDLIFYGHTHRPWEEQINKTRLVNPGTLAGMFQKATFAIYDTAKDKLELKILEIL